MQVRSGLEEIDWISGYRPLVSAARGIVGVLLSSGEVR